VQKREVVRAPSLVEAARNLPIRVVEIELKPPARAGVERMQPVGGYAIARDGHGRRDAGGGERAEREIAASERGFVARIEIRAHVHAIAVVGLPREREVAVREVPVVAPVRTGRGLRRVALEALDERAYRKLLAGFPPVAQRAEGFLVVAAARFGVEPLTVLSGVRDDVDHAVHRVRSPDGASRSGDDLDALDVGEQDVLHVPEHARVERRVDAASVDQHEQLVGEIAAEAADRDRPLVRVVARDLDVRREPQRVRNRRHTAAADILRSDHVDGGRSHVEAFGPPRRRRDLELAELLDAQVEGARGGLVCAPRRAGREDRAQRREQRRLTKRRFEVRQWHERMSAGARTKCAASRIAVEQGTPIAREYKRQRSPK
jgi:hypothetical protein